MHCLALVLGSAFTVSAQVTGANDIVTWVGTGSSQSEFVVQWNDGKSPTALAWGFRWDPVTSPTANDMIQALLQANVGLFARGDSATSYGASFYGFGYSTSGALAIAGAQDSLGNPSTVTFNRGFSDMNVNPVASEAPWSSIAASPVNPADRYQEGWNDNGYWELFTAAGTSYPSSWTSSLTGSSEPLVNNGWFAYTFSDPQFNSISPGVAVAALPEPASISLLLLAGLILLYAKKRLHAR